MIKYKIFDLLWLLAIFIIVIYHVKEPGRYDFWLTLILASLTMLRVGRLQHINKKLTEEEI